MRRRRRRQPEGDATATTTTAARFRRLSERAASAREEGDRAEDEPDRAEDERDDRERRGAAAPDELLTLIVGAGVSDDSEPVPVDDRAVRVGLLHLEGVGAAFGGWARNRKIESSRSARCRRSRSPSG